jgi:hypothetical protein
MGKGMLGRGIQHCFIPLPNIPLPGVFNIDRLPTPFTHRALSELSAVDETVLRLPLRDVIMEDNPAEPGANLAAGRFLCFHKDDWERGVPMLALGSESR